MSSLGSPSHHWGRAFRRPGGERRGQGAGHAVAHANSCGNAVWILFPESLTVFPYLSGKNLIECLCGLSLHSVTFMTVPCDCPFPAGPLLPTCPWLIASQPGEEACGLIAPEPAGHLSRGAHLTGRQLPGCSERPWQSEVAWAGGGETSSCIRPVDIYVPSLSRPSSLI